MGVFLDYGTICVPDLAPHGKTGTPSPSQTLIQGGNSDIQSENKTSVSPTQTLIQGGNSRELRHTI